MLNIGSKRVVFSTHFIVSATNQVSLHVNLGVEVLHFIFRSIPGATDLSTSARPERGGPVHINLKGGMGHLNETPAPLGPLADGTMLYSVYSFQSLAQDVGAGLVHYYLLQD